MTSDDNMSHEQLTYPGPAEITVTEMKVKVGSLLSQGKVILMLLLLQCSKWMSRSMAQH